MRPTTKRELADAARLAEVQYIRVRRTNHEDRWRLRIEGEVICDAVSYGVAQDEEPTWAIEHHHGGQGGFGSKEEVARHFIRVDEPAARYAEKSERLANRRSR